MEPESLSPPQLQQPDSGRPPYAFYALIAVGLIFVALIGWIVWRSYQASPAAPLHVVSTNPTLNKVATITPFVKLTFNKTLSSTGLSVTSNPDVISSDSVSGQILTINLKTPLDSSKKYTVTLQSVSDTSGGHISNEIFVFQPLAANPLTLPKDQQQTIVQQQGQAAADAPYGLENINFSNFDALVNGNDSGTFGGGVTANQEANLEYALFEFGSTQNPKSSTFTLDQDTIVQAPPPAGGYTSTTLTLNFDIAVDSDTDNYSARLDYTAPSTARLYMYKYHTTNLIYDSGAVTVNN